MLKNYYRIIASCWKNFGFGITFICWLLLLPLFLVFTHFTLLMDNIFFYSYRKISIKNPVFIIGNPRSGTTFLHNLLMRTEEVATFNTWHIIFPSLTARVLLKKLVDYFIQKKRSTMLPEQAGHEISLDKVQEEEFLFVHKLDTQFLLTPWSPLVFDDQEYPDLRFHDQQPEFRRKSSVEFFKGCLQRQILYTHKEQVIAQIHFSTHRIKTLLEVFPDAKFIYLVRSPYETIPSHLSLSRNAFENRWGAKNDILLNKINRYYERRYRYNIELYRYFYELQKNQDISQERMMILRYDELISNLQETIEKIVAFTDINYSEKLQQAIAEQSQTQKNYKRKHQVRELEEFGLTQEQIAKDFSFVFEEYGFDKNLDKKAAPG